eukprot:tig00000194_g14787.t1
MAKVVEVRVRPRREEPAAAARVAPALAPWFSLTFEAPDASSPAEAELMELATEMLAELQDGYVSLVGPRPACALPVRVELQPLPEDGGAGGPAEARPGDGPSSLRLSARPSCGRASLEPLERAAAALLLLGTAEPPAEWRWATDGLLGACAARRMPDSGRFQALRESLAASREAGAKASDPVAALLGAYPQVLNGERPSRPLAGSFVWFLSARERPALGRLAPMLRRPPAAPRTPAAGLLPFAKRRGGGGYWDPSSRLGGSRRHRVDRLARHWGAWLDREVTGVSGTPGLAWTTARLLGLLFGRPGLFLGYIGALLLANLTVPLLVALFSRTIDAAFKGDRALLVAFGPAAAGYSALGVLLSLLSTGVQSRLASGAVRDLQARIGRHVLAIADAALESLDPADVEGYAIFDAGALESPLAALCNALSGAGTVVMQVAASVASDPLVAGPVLGLQLLAALCLRPFSERAARASEERRAASSAAALRAREAVAGSRTIRAHGGAEAAAAGLADAFDALAAAQYRERVNGLRFSSVASSLSLFLQGAVLAACGLLVVEGYLSVTQLSQVYLSVAAVGASLSAVAAAVPEVSKANGPLLRVRAFLRIATDPPRRTPVPPSGSSPPPASDAGPLPVTVHRLTCIAPTFSARPFLDRVSFHVLPGSLACVLGPSGSGKSALLQLIAGAWAPQSGSVLLGTAPPEALLPSLRIVHRTPFVFRDTVRANIAYGTPGASLDDVKRAARLAKAEDLISSLPLGYDTVVDTRTLPAARRQRLGLARALAARPRLLLLDEFGSAMEAEAEGTLAASLSDLAKETTVIFATHRAAAAAAARPDLLLVLEGGRLVESGRPEDLLRRGGAYAALLRREGAEFGPLRTPQEVAAALRHFGPFAEAPAPALEALAAAAAVERLQRGDSLLPAGSSAPVGYVDLVLEGSLVREDIGGQTVLRRCEVLSASAVLRARPRAAGAVAAAEDARILRLPLRAVNAYARGLPAAALRAAFGLGPPQRAAFLWQRGGALAGHVAAFISGARLLAEEAAARRRAEEEARAAAAAAAAAAAVADREEPSAAPASAQADGPKPPEPAAAAVVVMDPGLEPTDLEPEPESSGALPHAAAPAVDVIDPTVQAQLDLEAQAATS